jgi:single-strand DNA-binding protein
MGQKNGFQRLIALGNLGRDAELKYTQSGKPMVLFSLAVSTGLGDNAQTEWFNVAKASEGMDKLVEYLKKGKTVLVEGRLKTKVREGDDGKKQYFTTLWADSLTLIADGTGGSKPAEDDMPVGSEDEIPF